MRFAFLLFALFATTVQAALPEPVSQALRFAGIPEDAVAVYALRLDAERPVLDENADRPLNPASVMKLVTTYAGLELLGPAYTWRTGFYAAKAPADGVIEGDLILKGTGDPALTLERFWSLVHALRVSGVREIRGDLVLDRSHFELMAFDPGAFDGDPYRPYNAGPDALPVNFKSTAFHFRVENGAVVITADPALPGIEIVNRVQADGARCNAWKSRIGFDVQEREGRSTIAFNGSYSSACGDQSFDLSLPRHADYVHQLFRALWREQGGVFEGAWRDGQVPAGAVSIVEADSPPMTEIVRQINKFSNNLMARQLLITLGTEQLGPPGSPEKGGRAVHRWLAASGMAFPELVVENGAGLSRIERISARHLGDLLAAAYAGPLMPEFMSSLPIYAVDGTFKRRSSDHAVAGRAHLKSGSLEGVRAIAGYLLDARGRRWAVVFMVNHPRAGASKPAQEALLEWLYNFSGEEEVAR